jgi:hypothetical protein
MKTLKTRVLKTATVNSVKLLTPADRIGLGFGVAAYPAGNQSQGLFPMPHNPVPEQVRPREELSAMRMHPHSHASDPVPPAGSAGLIPGRSARRFAPRAASFTSWRTRSTRTAAVGRSLFAVPSQADCPRDLRHNDRLESDCQSPDRSSDKRIATWEVCPSAAAGK